MDSMDNDAIPARILAAFAERSFVPFNEAALLFEVNPKTLRAEIDAGRVVCHHKGLGLKSPRRVFTLADFAESLHRLKERQCPDNNNVVPLSPSVDRARRSGILNSNSTTMIIAGRRVNVTRRKRKPSLTKSGAKPVPLPTAPDGPAASQ
jgi:hypothetical protein